MNCYDKLINNIKQTANMGIICEKCNSNEITEVIYGLPGWIVIDEPIDDRIMKLIDEKKVVLGGCSISKKNKKFYCRKCGNHFGDLNGNIYKNK